MLNNALIILGITLLIGCTDSHSISQNNVVSFKVLGNDTVTLPFTYDVNKNFTIQVYDRNDTVFTLLGDIQNSQLIEIDLSNRVFKRTIELTRIDGQTYPVFMHHYLNKDTIVILPDISNEDGLFHHSLIYAVDIEGSEVANYSIVNSPFRMYSEKMDSSQTTLFHNFQPLHFNKKRLFVDPLSFNSGMTLKENVKYKIPELGYFEFSGQNNLEFTTIPYVRNESNDTLRFGKEQEGMYFAIIDEDHILISHNNSHHLNLIDIHSGNIVKQSKESGRIISNPEPLDYPGAYTSRQPQQNSNSTLFKQLLYDQKKSLAFRFGLLPTHEELNLGDLNAFRFSNIWVGAYDSSLSLVGQSKVPEWFSLHPEPVFFRDHFITVKQGINEFEVVFQHVDLDTARVKQLVFDSIADELIHARPIISETNLNGLYESYKIRANSIILTVPSHSCPYCLNYSIDYYLTHLQKMEEEQIYLVVSEETATDALKSAQSRNVIIGKTRVLENLLNEGINNPTLMQWDGSKVIRSMLLPPGEVEQMSKYIQEFQQYQ